MIFTAEPRARWKREERVQSGLNIPNAPQPLQPMARHIEEMCSLLEFEENTRICPMWAPACLMIRCAETILRGNSKCPFMPSGERENH